MIMQKRTKLVNLKKYIYNYSRILTSFCLQLHAHTHTHAVVMATVLLSPLIHLQHMALYKSVLMAIFQVD